MTTIYRAKPVSPEVFSATDALEALPDTGIPLDMIAPEYRDAIAGRLRGLAGRDLDAIAVGLREGLVEEAIAENMPRKEGNTG